MKAFSPDQQKEIWSLEYQDYLELGNLIGKSFFRFIAWWELQVDPGEWSRMVTPSYSCESTETSISTK